MGAYLSTAKTEKESSDGENESFKFGASAMQGWRTAMEDAHATILDLDKDTSFFAVYDGHGGKEVAQYCARHLHEELLKTQAYKEGNLGEALISAYLRMDEMMLLEGGRLELKALTTDITEDITRKFRADDSNKTTQLRHGSIDSDPASPLSTKEEEMAEADGGAGAKSSDDGFMHQEGKGRSGGGEKQTGEEVSSEAGGSRKRKTKVDAEGPKSKGDCGTEGGCDTEGLSQCESQSTRTESGEEGEARKVENEATVAKGGGVEEGKTERVEGEGRLAWGVVEAGDTGGKGSKEKEASLKEVENDMEEEDEEEDLDYVVEGEDEEDDDFWKPDEAQPEHDTGKYLGPTAGCTAVAALVQGDALVVANAGDSRCVISRNGQAVELSKDHKPDLVEERKRIVHAGGFISDGRINGCLNLSRAIGDMEYKQNPQLDPSGQVVTAYPELRTATLQPGDEFLVLACDGVWDVMTSQDVVDFVRKRLQQQETIRHVSLICEEIFDHCIAPDRHGSGLGMDNMSVIVVLLKKHISPQLYSDRRVDSSEGSGG